MDQNKERNHFKRSSSGQNLETPEQGPIYRSHVDPQDSAQRKRFIKQSYDLKLPDKGRSYREKNSKETK